MKQVEKGEYGYITYRRKIQTIKSVIAFAIVLAVFLTGFLICKTRNNICTVMAVLCVLPASRFLVALLLYVRHKTPPREQYDSLAEKGSHLILLSDCVMTCKEKNINVPFAVITDTCIYCYTENQAFDEKYFEANVSGFIKSCGDTVKVKLYKNYDEFSKRVSTLNGLEYQRKKAERIKNDFLILVI